MNILWLFSLSRLKFYKNFFQNRPKHANSMRSCHGVFTDQFIFDPLYLEWAWWRFYFRGEKCPKMFLKINWSVKTPWHRLSIGDACSVLYMDSLPKTWNPGLYFLYCALTVEKSSEMHLHYCLNLRVFGSSLRFDQVLASMVLSKMECILLIQNCTSKMVANFMILPLLLIFQYFSVYGYFYEKID